MQLVLGLGGNLAGKWGGPKQAIETAIGGFADIDLDVTAVAPLYLTRPMGPAGQPDYVNTVVLCTGLCAPDVALKRVKSLERLAGRSNGRRWAARPLDIDILDCGGLVGTFGAGKRLILPHPGLHLRDFVLRPLADVAPRWRHPVSGLSAVQMLARLSPSQRFVRERL